MGKRTPLFQYHLQAGATMVEFCGWELPIHYGSQLEEHHAVRQDAGMFDVSHMLAVDITGEEAQRFLSYLLANDVHKAGVGKALYSCMLNTQGGILDDLIVYCLAPQRYRLVVNAGNRETDVAWIKKQAGSYQVIVTPRPELAILAVQGPNALEKIKQAFPEKSSQLMAGMKPFAVVVDHDRVFARTGYTGEDGYELMLPAEQVGEVWQKLSAHGVRPCGLGARDTLRLEAGMNLYGQDMTEDVTPYESGLAWTVSLSDHREFIGKQALLSQKAAGVPRKLVGVILQGKGVLRHGQVVIDQAGREGTVTSGTFSPTIKQSIGLVSVPEDASALEVIIRDKKWPLKVVSYPFVRKGKILV